VSPLPNLPSCSHTPTGKTTHYHLDVLTTGDHLAGHQCSCGSARSLRAGARAQAHFLTKYFTVFLFYHHTILS